MRTEKITTALQFLVVH